MKYQLLIDIITKLYTEIGDEYYNNFDKGHNKKHLHDVVVNAYMLSNKLGVSEFTKYLSIIAAIYHDTGLKYDRRLHHEYSKKIVLEDKRLRIFLTNSQIQIIASAVYNHRASLSGEVHHNSIVSKIVADADNIATIERLIERSYYYNLENYGDDLNNRVYNILYKKFSYNGTAKMVLDISNELEIVKEQKEILSDRKKFDKIYNEVIASL